MSENININATHYTLPTPPKPHQYPLLQSQITMQHQRARQPLGPAAAYQPSTPTSYSHFKNDHSHSPPPLKSSQTTQNSTSAPSAPYHFRPILSPPTSPPPQQNYPQINMSAIDLAGIQPPARFIGPYPPAYLSKEPVPSFENEEQASIPDNAADLSLSRPSKLGKSSCNPWDYLTADDVNNGEEEIGTGPGLGGGGKKSKMRRRFRKLELEALEVLWTWAKLPNMYQRQRLGAWLGVRTKHITVWFQNRRQEQKRHSRTGPSAPPPSRSSRGTYDPMTGKWRPVSISCISSLAPPPADKMSVIQKIANGEITREMFFSRPVIARDSSSLDQVLKARERDTTRRPRLNVDGLEGDEMLLAMMSSDPPSDEATESDSSPAKINISRIGPPGTIRRPSLGLGHPSGHPARSNRPPLQRSHTDFTIGRSTSLDILASARGTLLHPLPTYPAPRSSSGPSTTLDHFALYPKRAATSQPPPAPTHNNTSNNNTNKRTRLERHGSWSTLSLTIKHRDSFSRSQSHSHTSMKNSYSPPSPESPSDSESSIPTPQTRGSSNPGSASSTSTSPTTFTFTPTHTKSMMEQDKKGKGRSDEDMEVLNAAKGLLELFGGA